MDKLKAVIFDLDGTLGDTLPLCIRAFRQAVEPLIHRTISDAEIIATFGPSEEGTIMALAPLHYEKGVKGYLFFYEKFHDMCPAPFEGVREMLDKLKDKGIRLAMVTGKGEHSTRISLSRFHLDDYFEYIETGVASGPRKPEGMQVIINNFEGIAKEEMIYVGDSPSDISASREVGIPVVGAAWATTAEPDKLKALQPDQLFHSIADFSSWMDSKIG